MSTEPTLSELLRLKEQLMYRVTVVSLAGEQRIRYTIRAPDGRDIVAAYAPTVDEAMKLISRFTSP